MGSCCVTEQTKQNNTDICDEKKKLTKNKHDDQLVESDEEKEVEKNEINVSNFKYEVAEKLTPDELSTFPKDVIEVYNHECEYKLNENGKSVTFYPAPHITSSEYGKEIFEETLLSKSFIVTKNVTKLEGMNDWDEKLIIQDSICSFITCCCKAWTEHYPLKISPANILLLILQGIAVHVDKHSEKLRDKYVNHSEQKELTLYRDAIDNNFVFGSKDNDWSSVIDEFCDQIDKNTVKDTVRFMESDFSCSTAADKISIISNKITIMDICKNYFKYHGYSGICCGFPQITLDGTKTDWIKLRIKCENLLSKKVDKQFGKKWSTSLLPILDRFIAVYDGNIDCIFWNSMVKQSEFIHGMGSMPSIPQQYHGWINVFFPYMSEGYNGNFPENRYCFRPYEMTMGAKLRNFGNGGNDCSDYPTGLSSAPVKWTDQLKNEEHKLKFYSGFVGYKQCTKTFQLSPVVSWFIGH